MAYTASRKSSVFSFLFILITLFFSVSAHAQSFKIGGTGAALGGMQLLLDAFEEENPDVKGEVLSSLGSGGGIKALTKGAIDIAVSARKLKPQEQKNGLEEHFYAKTAIVLATPKKNKITDISSSEFVDIINGKMLTWADGSDIRMVLRPESETDVKLLKAHIPEMVAGWNALREIPGIPMAYTDQMAADMVQLIPGGIGINTLALIKAEDRPLKALNLNGFVPSIETIADGSYPLTKDFYFILSPESSETAKKFIAFLQSDKGKEILQNSGHYVPSAHGE